MFLTQQLHFYSIVNHAMYDYVYPCYESLCKENIARIISWMFEPHSFSYVLPPLSYIYLTFIFLIFLFQSVYVRAQPSKYVPNQVSFLSYTCYFVIILMWSGIEWRTGGKEGLPTFPAHFRSNKHFLPHLTSQACRNINFCATLLIPQQTGIEMKSSESQ